MWAKFWKINPYYYYLGGSISSYLFIWNKDFSRKLKFIPSSFIHFFQLCSQFFDPFRAMISPLESDFFLSSHFLNSGNKKYLLDAKSREYGWWGSKWKPNSLNFAIETANVGTLLFWWKGTFFLASYGCLFFKSSWNRSNNWHNISHWLFFPFERNRCGLYRVHPKKLFAIILLVCRPPPSLGEIVLLLGLWCVVVWCHVLSQS